MPPKPYSPKPILYSGPATPTAYDVSWQKFTNLTPDQIAWFQAQPEWQNFLAYVARSPNTATAATPIAVVNSVLAMPAPSTSSAALNVGTIQPGAKP